MKSGDNGFKEMMCGNDGFNEMRSSKRLYAERASAKKGSYSVQFVNLDSLYALLRGPDDWLCDFTFRLLTKCRRFATFATGGNVPNPNASSQND